MLRLILKFAIYALIIYCFSVLGLVEKLSINTVLILSAILAGVNTIIRPILVSIALPFNLITFGVASVFANLLSLVIANAIAGKALSGLWVMLLLSCIIMLADDMIRNIRNYNKRRVIIGDKE
jgi:uncharacterized membrane protein YvlD (DUF360 family)